MYENTAHYMYGQIDTSVEDLLLRKLKETGHHLLHNIGFFWSQKLSVRPRGKLLVQFDVQFRIQKVNGKFEAKLGELKNMGVISSCEKQKLDKKNFKLV